MDPSLQAPLLPGNYPPPSAPPMQAAYPQYSAPPMQAPYQQYSAPPMQAAYQQYSAPPMQTTYPPVYVQSMPPAPQRLGKTSQTMTCPRCMATMQTVVRHEAGFVTFAAAAGLCIVGCVPCCLYPFCMEACQDTIHTCPLCGVAVGSSKPY